MSSAQGSSLPNLVEFGQAVLQEKIKTATKN